MEYKKEAKGCDGRLQLSHASRFGWFMDYGNRIQKDALHNNIKDK